MHLRMEGPAEANNHQSGHISSDSKAFDDLPDQEDEEITIKDSSKYPGITKNTVFCFHILHFFYLYPTFCKQKITKNCFELFNTIFFSAIFEQILHPNRGRSRF